MAIVGLTGGIGSGKSTVVRLFGELGVHWGDADDVQTPAIALEQPGKQPQKDPSDLLILQHTDTRTRSETPTDC